MTFPTRSEWFQVFAAFAGFSYISGYWIGYSHTPSSEHLYGWTAFWTGCSFVCTHFSYPWQYVGGHIAFTGLIKNSGMLWSSYPFQGTGPMMEVWLPWIAGLVVTTLAFGSTYYRAFSVPWTRDTPVKSISLDEEAAPQLDAVPTGATEYDFTQPMHSLPKHYDAAGHLTLQDDVKIEEK